MKTKKLEKKLGLNKITISRLGSEMKNVKGGDISDTCPWTDTCLLTCNPYYCYESIETCETCIRIHTWCQAW